MNECHKILISRKPAIAAHLLLLWQLWWTIKGCIIEGFVSCHYAFLLVLNGKIISLCIVKNVP